MTDKSPEFIRMCETCGLEWTPEVGMILIQLKSRLLLLVLDILVPPDIESEGILIVRRLNNSKQFAIDKNTCVPFWSQEQLWDKLEFTLQEQLDCIGGKRSDENSIYNLFGTGLFNSFSQLLLAFAMQELHNKRWTGEGWEVVR